MDKKVEVRFGGAATSQPANLKVLGGGGSSVGGEGEREGEAALAMLQTQLICPICLQLFNKPVVILPCQHNLCRKCANELYQPSLFQARTTMMVNSGRFRCPTCRQEVVLDRHGVYGLQRNLLVENIIDAYKQEVDNDNCKASRPLPTTAPPQVTCLDHEGEKVNIYCLTCQVPTCSLCKVFGAHQSCQVAPLTDVYQQKKDELSEDVRSLLEFNCKVQALVDELEDTCRDIQESCRTQRQSVCEQFNRVSSLLEERHKAMTRQISAEQEEKTSRIQALVRCYGDSVEANRKLLEGVASSMEESDMAAFVQNSKDLIRKVMAASGFSPADALQPQYERMKRYRYDFSCQERALRSIDFLRTVKDVPEEPEVKPEEPKEPSDQNTEPEHLDTSDQDQESEGKPVAAPVEPVLTAAAASKTFTPIPPDPMEPERVVLLGEADHPDVPDGGSNQKKEKEEEEEEEEQLGLEEVEGGAALDPVKNGNTCAEQEGMSPQQVVTVLFYLLAFLLLLHRVWVYISRFLCT